MWRCVKVQASVAIATVLSLKPCCISKGLASVCQFYCRFPASFVLGPFLTQSTMGDVPRHRSTAGDGNIEFFFCSASSRTFCFLAALRVSVSGRLCFSLETQQSFVCLPLLLCDEVARSDLTAGLWCEA